MAPRRKMLTSALLSAGIAATGSVISGVSECGISHHVWFVALATGALAFLTDIKAYKATPP